MKRIRSEQRAGGLLRWAAVAVMLLAVAGPARGEEPGLGERFEQGRMTELLPLAEALPADDPVRLKLEEVAIPLQGYYEGAETRAERARFLDQAIDGLAGLIAEHETHEQRPAWQTKLGELKLVHRLQVIHDEAGLFYEFGIPTRQQIAAVERESRSARRALASAWERLGEIESALVQSPERAEADGRRERWEYLLETYQAQRTPFYLGQAAYYTALSAQPGRPGFVEPVAESELLATARQRLARFVADPSDRYGIRHTAMTFVARVHLREGELEAAGELIEPILEAEREDRDHFVAELVRAEVAKRQGAFVEAEASVARLRAHPMVERQPQYRLLVTDVAHRVRRAELAEGEGEDLARAWEPYGELFEQGREAAWGPGMRQHVNRRWAEQAASAEALAEFPPLAQAGIGRALRREGQRLLLQGEANDDASQRKRGRRYLEMAVEAAGVGRQAEAGELPTDLRAEARFDEALALYLLDGEEPGNVERVGRLMTGLAREHPEHPLAEEAIGYAADLLRWLHRHDPEGAEPAYREVAELLFERFGGLEAADDQRLYFGYHLLEAQGEHEAAEAMYGRVPRGHADYFEARRQRLALRARRWLEAQRSGEAAGIEAETVLAEAERLAEEARGAADAARAQAALAEARLVEAEVAAERGEVDAVLASLADFESDFADQPERVERAATLRISALMEAGELEQAGELAQGLMRESPGEAVSRMDDLLERMDERLTELEARQAEAKAGERAALEQQRQRLGERMQGLAESLLEWAEGGELTDRQRLGYELMRARGLRLAGKPDAARDRLERWLETFPDHALLLHHYAESLRAMGGEARLTEAARTYDRIIAGVEEPYPAHWWNAWMRRLEVNAELGRHTEDIPLRVRRLRQIDEDLGGPPYRQRLEELEAAFAP